MERRKAKIDPVLLTNNRVRATVERISGVKMPPTLDELVDQGKISIGDALEILNKNESRSWVLSWQYSPRDGFREVFDNKGGH